MSTASWMSKATLTKEFAEMDHPNNDTVSFNQEWHFEWNSDKTTSGYVGVFMLCNGKCPDSEPSTPADIAPFPLLWDDLLEKLNRRDDFYENVPLSHQQNGQASQKQRFNKIKITHIRLQIQTCFYVVTKCG